MRQGTWSSGLTVGLALLPAALYAYLGSHSRMIIDDFWHLRIAHENGPWENVLFWHNSWNGSYSDFFLHGLLAPFEESAPVITAVLIVVAWTLALTWLLRLALGLWGVGREALWIALSSSALIVAASIHAQYTPESFYWMSASLRYSLPLAGLTAWLGLLLRVESRQPKPKSLYAGTLTSALVCFAVAGVSEMYLALQFSFLSLLLAPAIILMRSIRIRSVPLLAAGWLGTLASLFVQWNAPGRINRHALLNTMPQFRPMRDPVALLRHTLADTYQLQMTPETLSGFALLFALGLLLALHLGRSARGNGSVSPWSAGARLPYLLTLLAQLTILPLLWSHVSDNPQFLGRFSVGFMVVVGLNSALILACALVIWRAGALADWLRRGRHRRNAFVFALALLGLASLAMPQLRPVQIDARNILYVSGLNLLLIAWLEWSVGAPKLLRLAPVAATALLLLTTASLPFVARLFVGIGGLRNFAGAAWMLVSLGLVWGFAIGQRLLWYGLPALPKFRLLCQFVVAAGFASIVAGQLQMLPSYRLFAAEWDARHSLFVDLKEAGVRHAEVPPRALDLTAFLRYRELVPDSGYASEQSLIDYYGFESLRLEQAD